MLEMLWAPGVSPGLVTDLYHPEAAHVAWRSGRNGLATFDLFVRRAPFGGAFLLVAGLEAALRFVEAFRYSEDDLRALGQWRRYAPGFLEALRGLRFTGEILAMAEGTVAFPHEPLLRVTAPFMEALLIESGLLQTVNTATLVATKAARITQAAEGRLVADFSLRRAHAPLTVARASSIGGCESTSFLAAAQRLGLTASGTVPHALIQLFETEREAFAAIAAGAESYALLLDTYDVRRAVHTAIEVAREAAAQFGHHLAAVRLDSGDLAADSRYVRTALDAAGLTGCRILASGDLDEFAIAELVADGAPIDGFGVGTSLGAATGSARHGVEGGALGGVYKLALYADTPGAAQPRMKLAAEKSTWPGLKQVYRRAGFAGDVIQLADEPPPAGAQSLLQPVVAGGRIVGGATPPLAQIRAAARTNLEALPEEWKRLRADRAYPVEYSPGLRALRRAAVERAEAQGGVAR
jgi:nicotinate phosphoribosyltransferase